MWLLFLLPLKFVSNEDFPVVNINPGELLKQQTILKILVLLELGMFFAGYQMESIMI